MYFENVDIRIGTFDEEVQAAVAYDLLFTALRAQVGPNSVMCPLARDEAAIARGLSSLRPAHTSTLAARDARRGSVGASLGSAATLSRAGADAAAVLDAEKLSIVSKNEEKRLLKRLWTTLSTHRLALLMATSHFRTRRYWRLIRRL